MMKYFHFLSGSPEVQGRSWAYFCVLVRPTERTENPGEGREERVEEWEGGEDGCEEGSDEEGNHISHSPHSSVTVIFGYLAELGRGLLAGLLLLPPDILCGACGGPNTWQHSVSVKTLSRAVTHNLLRWSHRDRSMGWWWGRLPPPYHWHYSSQWPASPGSRRNSSVRRSPGSSLTQSNVTSTGSAMEVLVTGSIELIWSFGILREKHEEETVVKQRSHHLLCSKSKRNKFSRRYKTREMTDYRILLKVNNVCSIQYPPTDGNLILDQINQKSWKCGSYWLAFSCRPLHAISLSRRPRVPPLQGGRRGPLRPHTRRPGQVQGEEETSTSQTRLVILLIIRRQKGTIDLCRSHEIQLYI